METHDYSNPTCKAEGQSNLFHTLTWLEETCEKCKPLSAMTCVRECKTWKLKNQLREIHGKMENPVFLEQLLNTLKNERRLRLLEMISRQRHSLNQIQQELRSLGYRHSRGTIVDEYINPLIEVALVQECANPYGLTILGQEVSNLIGDDHDLIGILPSHSECYEEKALDALLNGSMTYEDVKKVVPSKSVARVLARLKRTTLVHTTKDKDYIFFFKTKRNPGLSEFSTTEKKVYDNIPDEGISARKLSDAAEISLRRTYKYIRKLKGKKLVFTRKKPLAYSLTPRGTKLAKMLRTVRDLATNTYLITKQFLHGECEDHRLNEDTAKSERQDNSMISMTTMSLTTSD